MPDTTAKR